MSEQYHCASCNAPINLLTADFCNDCRKYFCSVCIHQCPGCEYYVCIECHDENELCKECSKDAVIVEGKDAPLTPGTA